jgi:tRNA 2-thiouridine synthesizing protein A
MVHYMTTTVLDLRGLSCPLPVLKANKAIKELILGDLLEILATDPAAPKDFEVFCKNTGHTLRSSTEEDNVFKIILIKQD